MTEIITITTQDNPAAELRIIARRASSLTSSQQATIESSIRGEIDRNFANESGGGRQWAALAPATIADRILNGYPGNHPILQRSGAYRHGWADGNDTDYVGSGNGWEMYVGNADFRTRFLELGTRRMPARPARVIDDGGINRIAAVIENVLASVIDG